MSAFREVSKHWQTISTQPYSITRHLLNSFSPNYQKPFHIFYNLCSDLIFPSSYCVSNSLPPVGLRCFCHLQSKTHPSSWMTRCSQPLESIITTFLQPTEASDPISSSSSNIKNLLSSKVCVMADRSYPSFQANCKRAFFFLNLAVEQVCR